MLYSPVIDDSYGKLPLRIPKAVLGDGVIEYSVAGNAKEGRLFVEKLKEEYGTETVKLLYIIFLIQPPSTASETPVI